MTRLLVAFVLLAALSAVWGWQEPPPPPQLKIVKAAARRVGSTIQVDGTVRNVAGRPLRRLTLKFEFLSSGRNVVTARKAQLEDARINPGEESSFSYELNDEARAVRFRISASDAKDEVLRVAAPGPYPIQ
jgi:hypothetical protein